MDNTNENGSSEKLVKDDPLALRNMIPPKSGSTKKRIRRYALPDIRRHVVNGRRFFTYYRGTDREIYLGNADYILQAVKEKRKRDCEGRG